MAEKPEPPLGEQHLAVISHQDFATTGPACRNSGLQRDDHLVDYRHFGIKPRRMMTNQAGY